MGGRAAHVQAGVLIVNRRRNSAFADCVGDAGDSEPTLLYGSAYYLMESIDAKRVMQIHEQR